MKKELSSDEKERLIAETFRNYSEYLNPGFIGSKKSAESREVEWRGDGALMYDVHDKPFIDCLAGYGVFVLGHRPKPVIDAVVSVYERMGLYSQELLNPLQGELAKKLAEITPGDLKYTYYHLGGGESNDAAIKLARGYHRTINKEDRYIHVTFRNAFHGKTFGALSATSRPSLKYRFLPLVPGINEPGTVAEFNDLDSFERVMANVGWKTASVIVEPVQGEGGIIVPSDEFLPGVRAICDKYGALLHVDEVQSGFCRAGKMFCCEYTNVSPDIMTLAKAMSGGVFPISATIVNRKVIDAAAENPWYYTNTFAGSAPGCAASLAAIDMMERENIAEQSRMKGAHLISELKKIAGEFPGVIKDVRGIGLWIGVEFESEEFGNNVSRGLFERDVLTAHTINNPRVMRLQPPVVITNEQLDSVVERFRDTVKAVKAKAK
ncbi:aminotransferase class III-fold pyridoxal phosphate-dependent enzyme [bacterium]|nr:aminotransferase class III-fold pyridoxal phosphate-dependent enzyme [bacterium]